MKNKWAVFAALWFALMIYGLIFRQSPPDGAPLFPHFDKMAHGLLFFSQFWLLARAYRTAKRRIPYLVLAISAVVLAAGTEWAQAAFTDTRTADFWDAVADVCGAAAALRLARHAEQIWARQHTEIKAK